MRNFLIFLFLLLLFLVQMLFLSSFRVLGVQGELLLIFVILWGYQRGMEEGMAMGLLCGFLIDLASSGFFFHSISYALIGLLVGSIRESFSGGGLVVVMGLVFLCTMGTRLMELLLLLAFQKEAAGILPIFFISALFNTLLTFFLYPLYRRVIGEGGDQGSFYGGLSA